MDSGEFARRRYRWHGVDGSIEHAIVTVAGASAVVVTEADGFHYEARWDPSWVFRSIEIARVGTQGRLRLEASNGKWFVDGMPRPDLAEAIDVDLSASPLTNTLPIRRLSLHIGDSADIVTAFVTFPALDVRTAAQRYTRTGRFTYTFESLETDFERTITVDADGFVVDYPGLFTRA